MRNQLFNVGKGPRLLPRVSVVLVVRMFVGFPMLMPMGVRMAVLVLVLMVMGMTMGVLMLMVMRVATAMIVGVMMSGCVLQMDIQFYA